MNNSVGKIIKTIGKIIIGLSVLAGIIVWITVGVLLIQLMLVLIL